MKMKRIKQMKAKAKTFKKGDQCTQNPKSRIHRENTKQSVFMQNKSKSGLTVEALQLHNEKVDDEDGDVNMSAPSMADGSSMASTEKSKAFSISGLTDCSNITFHKVIDKWQSKDALDQEKCAILAAVTEVIREKGGEENETEYYAALLTALQTSSDENSCAALSFLLNLVIKKIPKAVLQARFSESCKIYISHLECFSEAGRASLLTALIQCLSATLVAQDIICWSEASTLNTYQILLTFTLHTKPKVRKVATLSVQNLMKFSNLNHKKHPIGSATAKFILQMVDGKRISENPSLPNQVLNILKLCLQYFDEGNLKEICETILSFLSLSDNILKINTLDTLTQMFDANPSPECLTLDLNTKLISVLYDFQPSIDDVNIATTWLNTMASAHSNLSLLGNTSCFKILPMFYAKSIKFLLSQNRSVVLAAAEIMKKTSESCIESAISLVEEDVKSQDSVFVKIFKHIEDGLGFKYSPVWDIVLQSMKYMYSAFGKVCPAVFLKNIGSLVDLHETPDFPFKSVLEDTVGGAIKSLGPEVVLKERPLQLIPKDNVYQFKNAWLLPVLRDNIEKAEIQYFISHFLPMAAEVRQKEMQCREAKQELEAKVMETLFSQIWSLLPGFFCNPLDLLQSFPNIAKVLGTALLETENLRLVVLQSLRTLIAKCTDDEELKCIGKYSKNYMPILFNLYTDKNNDNEKLSVSLLETIKSFLVIADQGLIEVFLKSLLSKLDAFKEKREKHRLMDLAVCFTKYAEGESLECLYHLALSGITNSTDKTVQKKSYRILEELSFANSESCKSLLENKTEELVPLLLASLSTAVPSSQAPRLRCLSGIIKRLSVDNNKQDFLHKILPEVILCTKALSVKARAAAFDLLADIGSAFVYLSNAPKEECVETYFKTVAAGLAGSPHMASATLLAYTKLLHEYRHCLSVSIVTLTLENALELLKSKTGEVVKAGLLFVRAVCKIFDSNELSGLAERIVKNLFLRQMNSKNSYRCQLRSILQKLEKKCGYKQILAYVPEEHRRFMVHLHKTAERKKRLQNSNTKEVESDDKDNSGKTESWDDILAESDDEDEMEKKFKNMNVNKKEKSSTNTKTWILEGNDDAVDLLDSSASKSVVGTKPKECSISSKKSKEFSLSADGRLMINDNDDKDNDLDQEKPFDVGEKDLLAGYDKTPKQIKLGKRKQLENMPEDEDMPAYQPGGMGIHRETGQPPAKQKRFGEEYKAKKSGGDVKLKGKPDPYAYLPLNKDKLNKRKKAKLTGQFRGIVKAARKGANKGTKQRKDFSKK